MAWIMVDDLTGEQIAPEHAHRLTVVLDGDEIRGFDIARPLSVDSVLRDLGEQLGGRAAPLAPLDPGSLLDDDDPERVDVSAGQQPDVVHEDGSTQVGAPPAAEASGESAGDQPEPVTTGEADRGRPTDAQVRMWAQRYRVPCSTTGALKRSVREAYEASRGGPPTHVAVAAAAATNGHRLPERPPAEQQPPAVEAAGDGTRPRPEQRDLAEQLLEQGHGPVNVADRTGLLLADVRELKREMDQGAQR